MKTIKNQLRRAFTIVELVIVIAVVAALAAILIPTFVNVVNSANEAVDTSLVKNLNTILASEEILNGGQATTMGEALEWAEDNGYSVEKITPTSAGYDIAWDETSNRFVLMDGDTAVYSDDTTDETEWSLWYITTSNTISTSTDKQYYYASSTALSGTVTVTSSVDLSAQTNVTSVNVNATNSNVTVAVSNAALVVANEGTNLVNVYGTVTTITGSNYGSESLHIYGTVTGKIELSKGHVVAEAGSYIESLIITAETVTEENKVSVEVKSSATVNSIAATSSNVLSSINSYVSGASSSSIVSTTVSSDFAGGTGTAASPYQISTAEEFAKIGNFSDAMSAGTAYYFQLIENIDITEIESKLSSGSLAGTSCFSSYFCGEFDGNYKTISLGGGYAAIAEQTTGGATVKDLTIIQTESELGFLFAYLNYHTADETIFENITFESGLSSGTHITSDYGTSQFCKQTWGTVTFDNCINTVSYKIADSGNSELGAYAGVFVGNYMCSYNEIPAKVNYIDCINTGNVSGDYVGFLFGNNTGVSSGIIIAKSRSAVNTDATHAAIYVSGCENRGGTILATKKAMLAMSLGANSTVNDSVNETLLADSTMFTNTNGGYMLSSNITDMSLSLTSTETSKLLTINTSADSSISSYTVTYGVSLGFRDSNDGSTGSSYFSVSVNVSKDSVSSSTFNYITKIMTDTDYNETVSSGSKYADLAKSGTLTSDQGVEYILVGQTDGSYIAVISSTSAIEILARTGTVSMSCGAVPGYKLSCLDSSEVTIGTVTQTISELEATVTA